MTFKKRYVNEATVYEPGSTRTNAAINSAIPSGILTGITGLVSGLDTSDSLTMAGLGAVGGAATGAALAGGRDTALKSIAAPAAIAGGLALPMNAILQGHGFQIDPTGSAALTGGINGLLWASRNSGRKKEWL